MRRLVGNVVAVGVGLAIAVTGLELALRVLPTPNPPRRATDAGIARYTPNTAYAWSIGPRLASPVRGRTNNLGWVSAVDYDSTATTPLLALIGDSYVEAMMLPDSETIRATLARQAPGRRVYAFGVSGAPLSHYLAEADYARQTFHPSAMAVVIIGNDFDESLERLNQVSAGLTVFRDHPDSSLSPIVTPLRAAGSIRSILRHSALARYLFFGHVVASARATLAPREIYAGNARATAPPERIAWSRLALRAFLRDLPERSGLPPEKIILIMDGRRPEAGDGPRTYFDQMRDAVKQLGDSAGYAILDAQDVFARDYAVHHRRFGFVSDGHWNGYGHGVVAAAITHTPFWTNWTNPHDVATLSP